MRKPCELVGILNVTPDSFSDVGLFFDSKKAIRQAKKLFADGAALIDVGAESTNPWSQPLTWQEEWARLEPVLKELASSYSGKISLDTYHSETAEKALELDDFIINDVTMFRDQKMIKVVSTRKARCIVSHLSPKSKNIADAHKIPQTTAVDEVRTELLAKRDELILAGIPAENIILDPGIGFGKTMELNKKLLRFAEEVPDIAVMIGYSRKRFLGENRMELAPNLEAGKVAINSGARYLRVHDIAGHKQITEYE